MQAVYPKLSDRGVQILQSLYVNGPMKGFQLRRKLGISDTGELLRGLLELIDQRLIVASCPPTPEEVDRTHFAPLPSAQVTSQVILKEHAVAAAKMNADASVLAAGR